MNKWLRDNWAVMVGWLLLLVGGYTGAKLQVAKLEWKQEQDSRRIDKLETQQERTTQALGEMRSDLRLVAEWVREQKEHKGEK